MSTDSMDSGGKIGTPSHMGRNLGILAAVGVGVAGFLFFTMGSNKTNDARLAKFDAFRAAYAEKCNVPAFAKPAPDVVRDEYLTSANMEAAIATQTAALAAGAKCEDVAKALKAVDYAVPPAGPATN